MVSLSEREAILRGIRGAVVRRPRVEGGPQRRRGAVSAQRQARRVVKPVAVRPAMADARCHGPCKLRVHAVAPVEVYPADNATHEEKL